ncbi:hypothetical protein EVJ58_g7948 [Rhodofomes roseus]|uniref:Uncharacterized protein n=1 Tax=Rhodofomes roseus TaxID=34475 RepID=A0A4Y9Y536_9APHY|nr:hypothetical protein EVJ58_g7948 [Rhodofomes roseus]
MQARTSLFALAVLLLVALSQAAAVITPEKRVADPMNTNEDDLVRVRAHI